MAYDDALASRIRRALARRRRITEKTMFGGIAFLLDDKMFVGVAGKELMVRVGPDAYVASLAKRHVREMDFTGRPMNGYVFVRPAGCKTVPAVRKWTDLAASFVATLPKKKKKQKRAHKKWRPKTRRP